MILKEDKATLFQFKKQLLECNEETYIQFKAWKQTHLSNILPTEINSIHYNVKIRQF